MGIVALALLLLAILVDLQSWMDWFSHPLQREAQVARAGARLWRSMLIVTALLMIVTPLAWMRMAVGSSFTSLMHGARSRKRLGWMLPGIVAAAVAFRLPRLQESLWYDEIASWMTYAGRAATAGAVIGNFFDPINQPMHALLNYFSVQWWQDDLPIEIAFRLPALVFSLLSIVTVWGLGCAAFNQRIGLIAAGLAAVLPVSVLEGVEARAYSMVICFCAAMTWLLIEARRRHGAIWLWALYALVCGLGVWAHFVAAFAPIGHGAWLTWRTLRTGQWREAASGIMALVLAAAIAITLYAPMIPGMLQARSLFKAQSQSQPTVVGPEGLHALLQLGGSWYWWAAIPGLLLLIAGLAACLRLQNHAREAASGEVSEAVESATIGLPLMLIAVSLWGAWMYARFTLFVLPGAMLLMAIGIDALWRWQRWAGVAAAMLVLLASIAELAIRPPKQPLRDAADYIRASGGQGDRVLVIGLAHPVLLMYGDQLNITYSFMHGSDLARTFDPQHPPQWIVVEYPQSVPRAVHSLLKQWGYVEQKRFEGWVDWTNGDVIVYHRIHAR